MTDITFTITYDDNTPTATVQQPHTSPLPLSFDGNASDTHTGYLHAGHSVSRIDIDLQTAVNKASVTIAPVTGGTPALHRATPRVPTTATTASALQWSTTTTSTAQLELTAGVDPVDLDLTAGNRTPKPVKIHITRPLAQTVGPPVAPPPGPRSGTGPGPATPTTAPRKFAVVVGVNVYANDDVGLLRGAVADATWMHDELHARGFESALLLNADATRSAIGLALGQACCDAGPNDLVVFYFAGHGTFFHTLSDGVGNAAIVRREAICPYDFAPDHSATAISDAELLTAMFKCRGRVLLVLDSCFAGGFAHEPPPPPGLTPPFPHAATRFTPSVIAIGRPVHVSTFAAPFPPALRRAATVFTACKKHERAAEGEFDEGFRGAFTKFLGDCVGGGAAVEIDTLRDQLEKTLTHNGFEQHPELETKEPHRHFAE